MRVCKCGSFAINDDPDRERCDKCWRDATIVKLTAESDRVTCALCGCSIPRRASKSDARGQPICVDLCVASGCRYLAEIEQLRADVNRMVGHTDALNDIIAVRETDIERLRMDNARLIADGCPKGDWVPSKVAAAIRDERDKLRAELASARKVIVRTAEIKPFLHNGRYPMDVCLRVDYAVEWLQAHPEAAEPAKKEPTP